MKLLLTFALAVFASQAKAGGHHGAHHAAPPTRAHHQPLHHNRAKRGHAPNDAECIARTMYAEAGNQGQQGAAAVGHVVKTRAKLEHKSACRVLPGQFVTANIPAKLRTPYLDLANDILRGRIHDPTGGATHFFRRGSQTPSWYRRNRSIRIRDHVFVTVGDYVNRFN